MTKKSETPRKKTVASELPQASISAANTAAAETPRAKAPCRKTKAALLREMLAAPDGASVPGIMAATGWQAHTVRAALMSTAD